jgi:hypothetical protein
LQAYGYPLPALEGLPRDTSLATNPPVTASHETRDDSETRPTKMAPRYPWCGHGQRHIDRLRVGEDKQKRPRRVDISSLIEPRVRNN